jgi:hypothetical protein
MFSPVYIIPLKLYAFSLMSPMYKISKRGSVVKSHTSTRARDGAKSNVKRLKVYESVIASTDGVIS